MPITSGAPSNNPGLDYTRNTENTSVGFGKSAANSFIQSLVAPQAALDATTNLFDKIPKETFALDYYNTIKKETAENGTSGLGNFIGSTVGIAINPVNYVGGGIPAIAGDAARIGLEAVAPEAIKGVTSFIGKSLTTSGGFAGTMLPNNVVDNYNQDTNRLNTAGLASSVAENGAIGAAFPLIPFATGLLAKKLKSARDVAPDAAPEEAPNINTANADDLKANNTITDNEHAFMKAYQSGTPQEELEPLAKNAIDENNIPTNDKGVVTSILGSSDIKNVQSVMAHQLGSSQLPEDIRTALSDHIIKGKFDDIANNPTLIDGLRGFVDHVDEKLEQEPARTEAMNQLLDNHLTKGLKADAPLSQKALYNEIKSGNDIDDLSIPENIKKLIVHDDNIKRLKRNIKSTTKKIANSAEDSKPHYNNLLNTQNENLEKEISDREFMASSLHPADELTYMRKLMDYDGDLKSNEDYNRLHDLSQVWHNARTLKHIVDEKAEYKTQKAIRDVAKHLIDTHDAGMTATQNPANVIDYLKQSIEGKIAKAAKPEPLEPTSSVSHETIASSVESLPKSEFKKAAQAAIDKANELGAKKEDLDNFLACVSGAS